MIKMDYISEIAVPEGRRIIGIDAGSTVFKYVILGNNGIEDSGLAPASERETLLKGLEEILVSY